LTPVLDGRRAGPESELARKGLDHQRRRVNQITYHHHAIAESARQPLQPAAFFTWSASSAMEVEGVQVRIASGRPVCLLMLGWGQGRRHSDRELQFPGFQQPTLSAALTALVRLQPVAAGWMVVTG